METFQVITICFWYRKNELKNALLHSNNANLFNYTSTYSLDNIPADNVNHPHNAQNKLHCSDRTAIVLQLLAASQC